MIGAARPRKTLFLLVGVSGLSLAASWAVLLPPALTAWRARSAISYAALLQTGLPSGPETAAGTELSAADYVTFLAELAPQKDDPSADPWLFAALVVGYLRLHGVPLSEPGVAALYSTQTRDWVTTRAGDTWMSLAQAYAGNAELWPLLVLLNREWVEKRGLGLEAGRLAQVPLVDRLTAPEQRTNR